MKLVPAVNGVFVGTLKSLKANGTIARLINKMFEKSKKEREREREWISTNTS